MDRNENTAMLGVRKVPQLTHWASCDMIIFGLMQIQVGRASKVFIYIVLYCLKPTVGYTSCLTFISII